MFYKAHKDIVRYHTVHHDKIPQPFMDFRIFLIADIHRRHIREETIKSIQSKPDIVCIAGDLLERGVPRTRIKENILKLKQWGVPIYFVWGNNDYEQDPDQIRHLLDRLGVIVLADDIDVIQKNGAKINMIGFDYHVDDENREGLIDWHAVHDTFTIVLTHKPSSYDHLRHQEKRLIHLVLAGHTHGGQIRFFNLGFYQKGGITKDGKTTILVTEGYGYSLVPFRLGTNAECHMITLK
jgi:predicted MPP superfamily phosphohydrolase